MQKKIKALPFLFALMNSLALYFFAPLEWVWGTSTSGGGDNPAHLVLIRDLAQSLFEHHSLIHYSYSMWGGFEAFQFYFPLPYLFAALLSKWVGVSIAYNLTVLLSLVVLPLSLWLMTFILRFSLVAQFAAPIVALPLLFTRAHIMWGGNAYSALAGMVGNQWGFALLPIAWGFAVQSWKEQRLSLGAVVFGTLCGLSHFYALLFLGFTYTALFLSELIAGRRTLSAYKGILNGIFIPLLLSAWFVPLLAYKTWSSDFGGNWNIQFLNTFSSAEKGLFIAAILLLISSLIPNKKHDRRTSSVLLLLLIATVFSFFFGERMKTTILNNCRIWPLIYLTLWMSCITAINILSRFQVGAAFLALPLLGLAIPPQSNFQEIRTWMDWNWAGMEQKEGYSAFVPIIKRLNSLPPGRVLTSISSQLDGLLGTSRVFESLPVLTPHQVPIGGIVNSAPFASKAYLLQCLLTNKCAGWPPGPIVPQPDLNRAALWMNSLGIRYLLIHEQDLAPKVKANALFKVLETSQDFVLSELARTPSTVDVYENELPVLCLQNFKLAAANLARWDFIHQQGLRIAAQCTGQPNEIDSGAFLNLLSAEWTAGNRTFDLGSPPRNSPLNTMILVPGDQPQYPEIALKNFPYIADRGFDPWIFIPNNFRAPLNVAIPIWNPTNTIKRFRLAGEGFDIISDLGLRPLGDVQVGPGFGWVWMKWNQAYPNPTVRFEISDPELKSAVFTSKTIQLPNKLNTCETKLETSFHEMRLTTSCPGKPHVIKMNYYPKWGAEVPLSMNALGHITLTPKSNTTIIRHTPQPIDLLARWVSAISLLVLLAWRFLRRSSA